MDVVLGVSVADQVARLALVEASPQADGAVLDQYEVSLTDARASVAQLADTIAATKRSLTGDGHRLVGIRLCAATPDRAERIRTALCANGFADGDVTIVTQTEVIDVLRATNPLPTGAADTTAFAVARGAALTATALPPLDALDAALASSSGPQLAYSQTPPDSGSLDRLLADPPTATNDLPLQTAMAPLSDFTPWAAAEEDVPFVAPAGAGRRTRLLLIGSGVTGIAAVGVAVLAVSVAVRVQPTASAQNDIGGPVTSFMPKPHVVDEAVAVPTPAPPGPVIVAAADDPFGSGYSLPIGNGGSAGNQGGGGPGQAADPVGQAGQGEAGSADQPPPPPDSGAPAVDVGAITGPLQGLAGVILGNLIAQGKISTTPTTPTTTTTTSAPVADVSTTPSTTTPTSSAEPIYTDGSVTSSSSSTTSTTTSASTSAPVPVSALATPSSTTTTTTTPTTTTTTYPTTSSSSYVAPPPPSTTSETRETPHLVSTEPPVTHTTESTAEPAPQPVSTPETTERVEVPSSTQESSSSSSTASTTVTSTKSSRHS